MKKNGADVFESLTKSEVHRMVLSAMIKGRGAGHLANYLIVVQENEKRIIDIDLEECLIPYNRVNPLEQQIPEKFCWFIIMCRLSLLGFNQSDLSFDRAALLSVQHPSILPILKQYHEKFTQKYYDLEDQAIESQLARLEIIQEFAEKE